MKNISKKIIGIILILVLLSTNVVFAVSQSDINAKSQEKESTNNKIKETEAKKNEVTEIKNETQKEVEDLNSKITNYQDQISTLDEQIDDANAKIAEDQEKLEKAEKDYQEKEETIKKRLVAAYMSGDTSYLDFILNSKDLADFISSYYLVSEVTQMDKNLLDQISKEKEEIEQSKKEIEESKEQLTQSKEQKESINNELKKAKTEKDAKVSQLSDEEALLQKEIDELIEHESSISSKIKKMQQEYDEQIKKNNNTSNSSKNNSSNNSSINNGTSSYGFGWPVSNHSIGTGYGASGKLWSSGYHTGVDFPVSYGTPVYAVGNGQVFDTGYNRSYGNFVEIYHGNNLYSYYAHGSSVQVSIGQNVSKGQQIMLSGDTGNVRGAHLHFEIRTPGYKYANCVNPRTYLP